MTSFRSVHQVQAIKHGIKKKEVVIELNENLTLSLLSIQTLKILKHTKPIKTYKKITYEPKLKIQFASGSTTFEFDSGIDRDRFCHAIDRLLLLKKSDVSTLRDKRKLGENTLSSTFDKIKIFTSSFNMGNKPPPKNLGDWIPKDNFDLYVFAFQESSYNRKKKKKKKNSKKDQKKDRSNKKKKLENKNKNKKNKKNKKKNKKENDEEDEEEEEEEEEEKEEEEETKHITKSKTKKTNSTINLETEEIKKRQKKAKSCEKHINLLISNYLGEKYEPVAIHSMWEIRLMIYSKKELLTEISNIESHHVMTGVEGFAGNKGGVGISFRIDDTPLCFIGSHLAAHLEKLNQRNDDYYSILANLKNGVSTFDIFNQFHHIFFIGDLNYRIDIKRDNAWDKVYKMIESRQFHSLWQADQLNRVRTERIAFHGFEEPEPTFTPTYKFLVDKFQTRRYTKSGNRIPSWCDRVLVRTLPFSKIKRVKYYCCPQIESSDHIPVCSTFLLNTLLPIPPPQIFSSVVNLHSGILLQNVKITNLVTKLGSKNSCYLSFNSPLLTKENSTPPIKTKGELVWENEEIPMLEPITTNLDYMKRSYIFVAIKGKGSITSATDAYGWCAIPIGLGIKKEKKFQVEITKFGKLIGMLEGSIRVICTNDEQEYLEACKGRLTSSKETNGKNKKKSKK
ncbi:inositol 5-phosphatase [Anaeramoeba flamelloides]|uniref:Inositol 5-phosphatase n=1 Tax=Anaeramoeba flamelloides TaxID=1746091 RepID=A0ABQ8Z805_9EUKA|nr:inositol 5-phosphatase [Anaeramoeba flamelloides]